MGRQDRVLLEHQEPLAHIAQHLPIEARVLEHDAGQHDQRGDQIPRQPLFDAFLPALEREVIAREQRRQRREIGKRADARR